MFVVAAALLSFGTAEASRLRMPELVEPAALSTSSRQPRPGRTLLALSAVAHSADIGTTYLAFDAGYVEGNPRMRWAMKHPATALGVKAVTVVALEATARQLEKRGKKRVALAVRIGAVIGGAVPTLVNLRNVSRGRR